MWNGTAVKSCMVFAVQADGDEIVTVEGLAQDKRLHPLQEAYWKNDAVECGYYTPGMLMSAYGLLARETNRLKSKSRRRFRQSLSLHGLRQYRRSDQRGGDKLRVRGDMVSILKDIPMEERKMVPCRIPIPNRRHGEIVSRRRQAIVIPVDTGASTPMRTAQ